MYTGVNFFPDTVYIFILIQLSMTTLYTLQHLVRECDGSDIQGRSLDITHPLGSLGCLWKLRMINGQYHHRHLISQLVV